MPRPLIPPSEIIPGGGCRAYRATADLQTPAASFSRPLPDHQLQSLSRRVSHPLLRAGRSMPVTLAKAAASAAPSAPLADQPHRRPLELDVQPPPGEAACFEVIPGSVFFPRSSIIKWFYTASKSFRSLSPSKTSRFPLSPDLISEPLPRRSNPRRNEM